MKKYTCVNCGYVYDEKTGEPASKIPPGTPLESLPDDWECPDCGGGLERLGPKLRYLREMVDIEEVHE